MNSTTELPDLAAEWRNARALHPLYVNLAREFVIELPPCHDLEVGLEAPPQESVEQARQWLQELDNHIQIHQLRQFLQTTSLISEEALRNLLLHHLRKPARAEADRDKVDFLLVQYFSHCAPSRLQDEDVDAAYVSQILEPVLGNVDITAPEWLAPLDQIMIDANACPDLNGLLAQEILERSRNFKTSVGEKYFVPGAMVAFTRSSFLMRRIFFRLMHQDLNGILDGLRELERRGVRTLDCRRAQFSADEPVGRLRMICQSWKVMFHAEYSSGQPLRMLVDLRAVVEKALARTAPGDSQRHQAAAAAAGADSGTSEISDVGPPQDEVS
jgi:hypothetical protein